MWDLLSIRIASGHVIMWSVRLKAKPLLFSPQSSWMIVRIIGCLFQIFTFGLWKIHRVIKLAQNTYLFHSNPIMMISELGSNDGTPNQNRMTSEAPSLFWSVKRQIWTSVKSAELNICIISKMRNCIAPGYTNSTGRAATHRLTARKRVVFHRLPKGDRGKRITWLRSLFQKFPNRLREFYDLPDEETLVVCSEHFPDNTYEGKLIKIIFDYNIC